MTGNEASSSLTSQRSDIRSTCLKHSVFIISVLTLQVIVVRWFIAAGKVGALDGFGVFSVLPTVVLICGVIFFIIAIRRINGKQPPGPSVAYLSMLYFLAPFFAATFPLFSFDGECAYQDRRYSSIISQLASYQKMKATGGKPSLRGKVLLVTKTYSGGFRFSPRHFDLPKEIRALQPDEVGTIVLFESSGGEMKWNWTRKTISVRTRQTLSEEGYYTKTPLSLRLELIDIQSRTKYEANPPGSIYAYLEELPRR